MSHGLYRKEKAKTASRKLDNIHTQERMEQPREKNPVRQRRQLRRRTSQRRRKLTKTKKERRVSPRKPRQVTEKSRKRRDDVVSTLSRRKTCSSDNYGTTKQCPPRPGRRTLKIKISARRRDPRGSHPRKRGNNHREADTEKQEKRDAKGPTTGRQSAVNRHLRTCFTFGGPLRLALEIANANSI